jgi:hypothetical protein
MYEFIVTIILITIFVLWIGLCLSVYKKLTNYKEELINNYNELYVIIEKKFKLVSDSVLKKDITLIELVNRFKALEDIDDVINISLELDREVLNYKRRIWYKDYKVLLEEINSIKSKYNDNVLRFNNILKMFPVNIVSNLFGFDTWLYYRND